MNSSFRKNVIWNTLGTGLNTFLSLFFLIMVTRINGLDEAGIFAFSFSSACLFFILGIYAGRIYQVTDHTNINDKEFIVNRIFTSGSILIVAIVFLLFKDYSWHKNFVFVVLALYKALESFSDVLYGVMQKNERLDIVGKSYLIKSILSIIVFLVVDLLTHDIVLSSLSMLILCLLVTLIYDYKNANVFIKIKDKVKSENVKKIFKSGFLVFIIAFISVFILNIPKYVIDQYLDNEAQAIFGIIIMPATVITLFSQFVIYPMLTKISKLCKDKDKKGVFSLVSKMLLLVVGFGILCIIGAYIIGIPILELIYNVKLTDYKMSLAIVLLASTISVSAGMLQPFLIAIRKNFVQVVLGTITIIIEIILSIIFIKNYGINGAVYAYLTAMIINAIMFYIAFYCIINNMMKGD